MYQVKRVVIREGALVGFVQHMPSEKFVLEGRKVFNSKSLEWLNWDTEHRRSLVRYGSAKLLKEYGWWTFIFSAEKRCNYWLALEFSYKLAEKEALIYLERVCLFESKTKTYIVTDHRWGVDASQDNYWRALAYWKHLRLVNDMQTREAVNIYRASKNLQFGLYK